MSSKTAEKYGKKIDLKGSLKYVRLGQMKVSPHAQRELRPHRVDHLATIFDPDKMGIPVLSHRDGHYGILDGQHRIGAFKKWNGPGWEEVAIECRVLQGLTEAEEAEYFLSLSDTLAISAFDKFRIAVVAGRSPEVDIAEILNGLDLRVSRHKDPGCICSVSTLLKSYTRDGEDAFRKGIVICKNAYGDAGLTSAAIDGLGLFCRRYNGTIDEASAIEHLSKVSGSVNGLINLAKTLRAKTGSTLSFCVAGAAVQVINRGLTGRSKLAGWFKEPER